MVPSAPTSAPGASRSDAPPKPRRFCARRAASSSDSALARLVRSPAFQRALRRPPAASSPSSAAAAAAAAAFFRRAVVAAAPGSDLRGRGRADAPRVLACRRLSRTPHALHSVLAPSGPLRHKGVVCVLQCAQRLPAMPGRSPVSAAVCRSGRSGNERRSVSRQSVAFFFSLQGNARSTQKKKPKPSSFRVSENRASCCLASD